MQPTSAPVLEAPTPEPAEAPRPLERGVRGERWRPIGDRSRFEAMLDPWFAEEVAAEVEDGELLHRCIQCGTCSSVCPLSAYMDLTPRRLIAMVRAGARDDVLHAVAPWVCTSCYACTVECPKRIPITGIMHALRRISYRERTYPRRFVTPVMAEAFVDMVRRRGRSTESWISLRLYLATRPGELVRNALVGARLARRGRLGIRPEGIRGRRDLARMLQAMRG